ncbi:MAG: transglutaminase family protein [Candidatus Heimdallarchaeota archaeon]
MKKPKLNNKNKFVVKLGFIIIIVLLLLGGITIEYTVEQNETLKGKADFQLTYRYRMQNQGPLNLSSVSLRLALLKTWDPVQTVDSINIRTEPNQTTSDEYENSFVWYNYENFNVGQWIDLQFDVNITLNLLDYSTAKLNVLDYDVNDPLYKLYTRYHPFTDTTDPGIQKVAQELTSSNNPLEIAYEAYNFSSTYITYKLLTNEKGAPWALRNAYGDCNEYTDLFMALIKARGVPAVEHTAWLAEFKEGFTTSDEGAAAHAYPMFYINGIGLLPADPTRGNSNLFDNWLKTDEQRITLTRGPDQPYRKLVYRWIPVEGIDSPLIQSNYTITINKLDINYFSTLRKVLVILVIGIPTVFAIYNIVKGRFARNNAIDKREKLLSPTRKALESKKNNP